MNIPYNTLRHVDWPVGALLLLLADVSEADSSTIKYGRDALSSVKMTKGNIFQL